MYPNTDANGIFPRLREYNGYLNVTIHCRSIQLENPRQMLIQEKNVLHT